MLFMQFSHFMVLSRFTEVELIVKMQSQYIHAYINTIHTFIYLYVFVPQHIPMKNNKLKVFLLYSAASIEGLVGT